MVCVFHDVGRGLCMCLGAIGCWAYGYHSRSRTFSHSRYLPLGISSRVFHGQWTIGDRHRGAKVTVARWKVLPRGRKLAMLRRQPAFPPLGFGKCVCVCTGSRGTPGRVHAKLRACPHSRRRPSRSRHPTYRRFDAVSSFVSIPPAPLLLGVLTSPSFPPLLPFVLMLQGAFTHTRPTSPSTSFDRSAAGLCTLTCLLLSDWRLKNSILHFHVHLMYQQLHTYIPRNFLLPRMHCLFIVLPIHHVHLLAFDHDHF